MPTLASHVRVEQSLREATLATREGTRWCAPAVPSPAGVAARSVRTARIPPPPSGRL